MKPKTFSRVILAAAGLLALPLLGACEEKKPAPPAPAGTDTGGHATHGGAVIDLGTATLGPFEAKATRDEGQIIAGKDAPIDVTVTPVPGSAAKAVAVRFWIGTQDAAGSVKARADVEDPAEPNRWHTHAEIPNPIPADARLWVEIEDDQGATSTGSFELKA